MEILKNTHSKTYDIHLLTKALFIVRKFHCKDWKQTKLLYFSGILECIKEIMMLTEMSTTREAAELAAMILENPDSMVLWLKFANDRMLVNSACTNDHIVQWGEPTRLPPGRGLYRNWGGFFDFGDMLEICGGIQVPTRVMEQWSISFWVILPLSIFDTR